MEPKSRPKILEIFDQAIDLPESERSEFISRACGGDADCEDEVKSLIAYSPSTMSSGFDFLEDELIGSVISDRYLIEKKIGGGGMGDVYLALDQRVKEQQVVIKFLAEALAMNNAVLQRFEREVEALARVNHKGVVRVTDCAEDSGRHYFVMPYLRGQVLRDRIGHKGMDPKTAGAILKQIGEALDAVHDVGVIHRDLKPENIMLVSPADDVVLIDFGIAKVQNSDNTLKTATGVTPGTINYMSPEQLRGEETTIASDIFSMGVVAYELVTGRRPFDRSAPGALTRIGSGAVPILNRKLSPKVDQLIRQALEFDPDKRPKRAGQLGIALAAALVAQVGVSVWAKFAIGGLIVFLAAVSAYVVYQYNHAVPAGTSHEMSYWLTVQRMRDGKEYGEASKSHGKNEIFDRDDKFKLTVADAAPGYLYIFYEGPPESNDTNFRMLYPTTRLNGGSSTIGAGQPVATDWITFRGPPGTENIWIAWSSSPMNELEAVKTAAFNHPRGGLSHEQLVAVKEFLQRKKDESAVRVWHYKATNTAVVRGKRDFLITLARFQHR